MADRSQLPDMTLTADEAAFLAARLRRLFHHFDYPLPEFARSDSSVINIAGSAIGGLLTNLSRGVPGAVNAACGVHGPIPCEGARCICAAGVQVSDVPSMKERIAAALECLEDNDNHGATVILKAALAVKDQS